MGPAGGERNENLGGFSSASAPILLPPTQGDSHEASLDASSLWEPGCSMRTGLEDATTLDHRMEVAPLYSSPPAVIIACSHNAADRLIARHSN